MLAIPALRRLKQENFVPTQKDKPEVPENDRGL